MEAVDNISSKAELLLEYVRNNEAEKVRTLVKDHLELLKYKYGKPFEGKTIIHIVCSTLSHEVKEETVKALIELGADLCEYYFGFNNGYKSIHLAALSLNSKLLRNICSHLEQEQIDSTVKYENETALLLIIKCRGCESRNTLDCIRVLLDHKADVNIVNDDGESPIWWAAFKGYKRVVGLLLSRYPGIDIDNCPGWPSMTARDIIIKYNLYDKKKLPPKKTISNLVQPSCTSRIFKKNSEDDSSLELLEFDQQHETDVLIEMEQSISDAEKLLEYVRRNYVEKIRELVEGNRELLKYRYGKPFEGKTIIHIVCSTLADEVRKETVQTLIDLGVDLCEYDSDGYQAIHLAALSLNAQLLRIICSHLEQEQIDNKIENGRYKALLLIIDDCDCECRYALDCIEVLLEHKADVNKVNDDGESPIWLAADKGYKRVVGLLLSRYPGIDIDSRPKIESITAKDLIIENNLYDKEKLSPFTERHLRLKQMFETLREGREDDFLKFENIESFVDTKFKGKTMLKICAELNLLKYARHLVELGAEVDYGDLTIAARNGSFEMFEALSVKLNKIPTFLFESKDGPQTAKNEYRECLRLLLNNNKSLVNRREKDGYTALHWACRLGADEDVIQMLLEFGAYLGGTDLWGNVEIDGINIEILRKVFNNCITCYSKYDIDDKKLEVNFNYQTSVPGNDSDDGMMPEMTVIAHIAGCHKLQPFLNHPLITSFIQMKWHRLRFFIYANLLLYLTTWFFLVLYTLNVYNNKTDYREEPSGYRIPLLMIIWMTFILFIVKEFLQLIISPLMYFKQLENYLEMAFIISIALILSWPKPSDNTRKQLSAFTILASSFQLVFLLGQLPMMSAYIIMLRTVFWSFFKLLLWNAILILSFGFSFYTLFAHNTETSDKQSLDNSTCANEEKNPFDGIGVSIFRTFVMMTGEFDASDIDFDTVPWSWFVFVLFIFMIVIVLSNLMSGLAVSDTQEIKSNAEFLALKLRVDHIYYIEKMLLGKIAFMKLPKILIEMTHLFPNYLERFQMKVYLNKKGKIALPLRNSHGWLYKKIFETVRLDGETLKKVRLLLKERNSFKAEDSVQEKLKAVYDSMQQNLGRAVDTLQKRLDSVDGSMKGNFGTAVDTLQKRLDSVDDSMQKKLGTVDDTMRKELKIVVDHLQKRLDTVDDSVKEKLETVDKAMQKFKIVVNSLEKRQEAIENQQKQILQNLNAMSENMIKLLEKLK